jgi:hypothetical protein
LPAPAPLPLPEPQPLIVPGKPESPLARRRMLREENSAIVAELVHLVQKTHAEVNADLNRKVGIKRVSEATVRQLEQRLEHARAWLRKR